MTSTAHSRRGFSLVEMLVVISIIVLAIAIAIPSIQKVREASNRLQCMSNLRQLGMAASNYHSDHGKLPPGYVGPPSTEPGNTVSGQWIGHFPMLLPYIEQDNIAKTIRVNFDIRKVSANQWFYEDNGSFPNVANILASLNLVKLFRCPSAPDYTPGRGHADEGTIVGIHVFNTKTGSVSTTWKVYDYSIPEELNALAATTYTGIAGTGLGDHPFYRYFDGIYVNRVQRTLGQISAADGTGNTLMYGECCGTQMNGKNETMDISWMAAGGLGSYQGIFRKATGHVTALSSYHTFGAGFCFADGSVRTLKYGRTQWNNSTDGNSEDWLTLQQLAGWRDGAAISSILESY